MVIAVQQGREENTLPALTASGTDADPNGLGAGGSKKTTIRFRHRRRVKILNSKFLSHSCGFRQVTTVGSRLLSCNLYLCNACFFPEFGNDNRLYSMSMPCRLLRPWCTLWTNFFVACPCFWLFVTVVHVAISSLLEPLWILFLVTHFTLSCECSLRESNTHWSQPDPPFFVNLLIPTSLWCFY